MDSGWTKRWRKRWTKGYHKDLLSWILMDYFIDFAAYETTTRYIPGAGNVPLERGQWAFTERELAEFFSVDRQRIRTCLKRLYNKPFVNPQINPKYTLVTVINYDNYQSDNQTTNPKLTRCLTTTKPAANPKQDSTIRKEIKNIYRESVEIPNWIDPETWAAFKEFRIRIKAPLTNRAIKNIITELEKLKNQGNDPNAVIDQSITRGWRGVFALNNGAAKKPIDVTGSVTPPDRANKILQKMQERERMLRGENDPT